MAAPVVSATAVELDVEGADFLGFAFVSAPKGALRVEYYQASRSWRRL